MLWNVDSNHSRPLVGQIAANVRRAVAEGTLTEGERLPTAVELGRVLQVNPNTVLAAYRLLRDEGVLDFRRGRGVRIRTGAATHTPVVEAIRRLVEIGQAHGYSNAELADLLVALPEADRP